MVWSPTCPVCPPPLHGKCHLKFPFWFSAHLPKLSSPLKVRFYWHLIKRIFNLTLGPYETFMDGHRNICTYPFCKHSCQIYDAVWWFALRQSFFSPRLSGCQRTLRLVFLQLGAGLSTCNVRDFICLYAEVMTFAQTAFAILNSYVFLGKYRVAVSKHLLFRTTSQMLYMPM